MKHVAFLAIALIGMTFIISQDASAQLAANKAFSLTGSGFAASKSSIDDASIDLLFVTAKTKTNTDFGFQSGTLTIGDKALTVSDFSGSVLGDGKFFRISSKASTNEDQFTIKALGRLVDKTATDSIYSLTGTMTDSKKVTTKFVYTTKISEITVKTDSATKSDITIKILKGSANPNDQTYIGQTGGFLFNYFSEDRVTISPGGTITFVNEDTSSHLLKSGVASSRAHKKSFVADDKISSGVIMPGKSWNVKFDEPGFFRLFDENYQWMDVTIFVIDTSKISKTKTPLN